MMMMFELLMQTGVIVNTHTCTHTTCMYYDVVWIHVSTNRFCNAREAVPVAVRFL